MNQIRTRISAVTGMLLLSAHSMFGFVTTAGGTSTSTGLPWETPLQTIQTSLTGPVAFAISVIAMAAVGGMLVFGGELTEFTRKACLLVLAIAFLVGGSGLITTLFPTAVSGALI